MRMRTIAIVAGGPASLIPELNTFEDVQVWIGVDRGAYVIKQNQLPLTYALGDFDSITDEMYDDIIQTSQKIKKYRPEKNESDLELAVELALTMKPDLIYIFGATGGRLDHALINL